MTNLTLEVNFWFQEKQADAQSREQLLQSFKEQESQSATKVWLFVLLKKTNITIHCNNDDIAPICDVCTQICELQSSLKMYREEVDVYQQQMEELKMNYESKLQKKNEKVEC